MPTHTNTNTTAAPNRTGLLIATSLTLFSMFFGAGNLIFPPIMGANAGTSFPWAMTGFLIGAVALPVLSIITIALSGTDLRDLASRGGRVFGIVFPDSSTCRSGPSTRCRERGPCPSPRPSRP